MISLRLGHGFNDPASSCENEAHRLDIASRSGLDESKLSKLLKPLCIEYLDYTRVADAIAEPGQTQGGAGGIKGLLLGSDFVR